MKLREYKVRIPFVPFHLMKALHAAGLDAAEKLVVSIACASAKPVGQELEAARKSEDSQWRTVFMTAKIAEEACVDRDACTRAKKKLEAAGLANQTADYNHVKRVAEEWNVTTLIHLATMAQADAAIARVEERIGKRTKRKYHPPKKNDVAFWLQYVGEIPFESPPTTPTARAWN